MEQDECRGIDKLRSKKGFSLTSNLFEALQKLRLDDAGGKLRPIWVSDTSH
jgi:hypothetical protein